MNLHLVDRGRVWLALFVLTLFGLPDKADGGLLSRLRARRCRPIVCEPSPCQPCEAQPVARAAAALTCDGKLCPASVVAQFNIPGTSVCLYKTYLCQKCGDGWVYYDGNCSLSVPTNCTDCVGCVRAPIIVIPPPPPKSAEGQKEADPPVEQYARGVGQEMVDGGVPPDSPLQESDDYEAETVVEDGVKQRGKVFEMPLLDDQQKPTGETVVVHLDWLKPKNNGGSPHRKPVGTGYQTLKEKPKDLKYVHKRYAANVYAVWEEQGNNNYRFYVVFLPKEEAK